MTLAEEYCKANVPMTIWNGIINSYYDGKNFNNLIFDRCFSYGNNGVCSMEQYYNACMDYLNNMKYSKNGYEKFVKDISWHYMWGSDKSDWKQELKDLGCKTNKEFIQLAKRIIETI